MAIYLSDKNGNLIKYAGNGAIGNAGTSINSLDKEMAGTFRQTSYIDVKIPSNAPIIPTSDYTEFANILYQYKDIYSRIQGVDYESNGMTDLGNGSHTFTWFNAGEGGGQPASKYISSVEDIVTNLQNKAPTGLKLQHLDPIYSYESDGNKYVAGKLISIVELTPIIDFLADRLEYPAVISVEYTISAPVGGGTVKGGRLDALSRVVCNDKTDLLNSLDTLQSNHDTDNLTITSILFHHIEYTNADKLVENSNTKASISYGSLDYDDIIKSNNSSVRIKSVDTSASDQILNNNYNNIDISLMKGTEFAVDVNGTSNIIYNVLKLPGLDNFDLSEPTRLGMSTLDHRDNLFAVKGSEMVITDINTRQSYFDFNTSSDGLLINTASMEADNFNALEYDSSIEITSDKLQLKHLKNNSADSISERTGDIKIDDSGVNLAYTANGIESTVLSLYDGKATLNGVELALKTDISTVDTSNLVLKEVTAEDGKSAIDNDGYHIKAYSITPDTDKDKLLSVLDFDDGEDFSKGKGIIFEQSPHHGLYTAVEGDGSTYTNLSMAQIDTFEGAIIGHMSFTQDESITSVLGAGSEAVAMQRIKQNSEDELLSNISLTDDGIMLTYGNNEVYTTLSLCDGKATLNDVELALKTDLDGINIDTSNLVSKLNTKETITENASDIALTKNTTNVYMGAVNIQENNPAILMQIVPLDNRGALSGNQAMFSLHPNSTGLMAAGQQLTLDVNGVKVNNEIIATEPYIDGKFEYSGVSHDTKITKADTDLGNGFLVEVGTPGFSMNTLGISGGSGYSSYLSVDGNLGNLASVELNISEDTGNMDLSGGMLSVSQSDSDGAACQFGYTKGIINTNDFSQSFVQNSFNADSTSVSMIVGDTTTSADTNTFTAMSVNVTSNDINFSYYSSDIDNETEDAHNLIFTKEGSLTLDNNEIATQKWVTDTLLGEGAHEDLNTIGELSDALQDNKDIITVLNQAITNKANASEVLPLSAGSTKPLTDDLYVTSGKSLRLGNHAFIKGDDTDGRLTISAGKDRIITIRPNPENSTGQMHIYGTVFRPGSKDGVQLGTDSAPWSAIYGTALYQDGKQVANKEDLSNYLPTTGGDLSGSLSIKASSLGVTALTLEGAYSSTSISFKSTNYGDVAALIAKSDSLRPSWQHYKFNEEDGGFSGSIALLSDVPTITQNGEIVKSLDVDALIERIEALENQLASIANNTDIDTLFNS